MMKACNHCGKRRYENHMIDRKVLAGWESDDTICVWCLGIEASERELYPDSDNLILCPRCKGQEILRTSAVCGVCWAEIQADLH